MKQLTDEVFAQVREALAMNRVMGRDADGNYTRECTPKKITAAIAALDTAQPVQVNAMVMEALERMVESVTGVDQVSAVNEARAVLTAAKQAQPERAPSTKGSDQVWFAQSYGIKQGGQHD